MKRVVIVFLAKGVSPQKKSKLREKVNVSISSPLRKYICHGCRDAPAWPPFRTKVLIPATQCCWITAESLPRNRPRPKGAALLKVILPPRGQFTFNVGYKVLALCLDWGQFWRAKPVLDQPCLLSNPLLLSNPASFSFPIDSLLPRSWSLFPGNPRTTWVKP